MTRVITPTDRQASALRKRLNKLLAQYGYADHSLTAAEAAMALEVQQAVAAIHARHEPLLTSLRGKRQGAIDAMVAIVSDDDKWMLAMHGQSGKTLSLRSGTISRRITSKTVVTDVQAVLDGLRRRGKLRAYTTQPDPQLNKRALLRARGLVSKLAGIDIVDGENAVFKPQQYGSKTESELPVSRPIR